MPHIIYNYTKEDHEYAVSVARQRHEWVIRRGLSTRYRDYKFAFFDNYMGTMGETGLKKGFLIPSGIEFTEAEPCPEQTKRITHDFIVRGQKIGAKTFKLTDDNPRERQSYYTYPAKCLPEVGCRHQNGYPDILVQAGLYKSQRLIQLRGWIYGNEIEEIKELIELHGEMAHKIPRKLYKPIHDLKAVFVQPEEPDFEKFLDISAQYPVIENP